MVVIKNNLVLCIVFCAIQTEFFVIAGGPKVLNLFNMPHLDLTKLTLDFLDEEVFEPNSIKKIINDEDSNRRGIISDDEYFRNTISFIRNLKEKEGPAEVVFDDEIFESQAPDDFKLALPIKFSAEEVLIRRFFELERIMQGGGGALRGGCNELLTKYLNPLFEKNKLEKIIRIALANRCFMSLFVYLFADITHSMLGVDYIHGWYVIGFNKASRERPLEYEPFLIVREDILNAFLSQMYSYDEQVVIEMKKRFNILCGKPNRVRKAFLEQYFSPNIKRPIC